MYPPALENCSRKVPDGFHYNDPRKHDFYRLLIVHPTERRRIVAPFIKYNMSKTNPTISGTFGGNNPIITADLRPIPADYNTPVLSKEQIRLFHAEEPFADAVNRVLQDHMTYDIVVGVNYYRYLHQQI